MAARIPRDVDLEDTLVYGLTPLRFGYLVVAVLAAVAVWRLGVAAALRVPACAVLGGAGAALAWGRWRGRALDRWALDALVFVRRNVRVAAPRRRQRRSGAVAVRLAPIRALRPPAGGPPVA